MPLGFYRVFQGKGQGPFRSLAHQAKFMDTQVEYKTWNRVYSRTRRLGWMPVAAQTQTLGLRFSPGGFCHIHEKILQ